MEVQTIVALLKNSRSSAYSSAGETAEVSCLASVQDVSASGTVFDNASGLLASPTVSVQHQCQYESVKQKVLSSQTTVGSQKCVIIMTDAQAVISAQLNFMQIIIILTANSYLK